MPDSSMAAGDRVHDRTATKPKALFTFAGLIGLVVTELAFAAWPGIVWESTVRGADGAGLEARTARIAAVDAHGNLIVAGRQSGAVAGSCMYAAKLARADGALMWSRTDCSANSDALAMGVDRNGDVLVAGYARLPSLLFDARVWKLRGTDGSTLWERTLDLGGTSPSSIEGAYDVATDSAGSVYLALSGGSVARLAKYSADGNLAWNVPAGPHLALLRVDGQGDVHAAGLQDAGEAGSDWAVARFAGSTGERLWLRALGAPGSAPVAMAVTPDGGTVVTGRAPGPGNHDLLTVKYAVNGGYAWQRRFATDGEDAGYAIGVDAQGDLAVTGRAGDRLVTLRQRGSDGETLWQRTQPATRAGRDFGVALAFDAAGDIVVAGTEGVTDVMFNDTRVRAIRYARGDGAEVWSMSREVFVDGSVQDVARTLVASGDSVYLMATNSGFGPESLFIGRYTLEALPAASVQGLWWRWPPGSEPGWGINLVHQGDTLFATWFTYRSDGTPLWLVMSAGERTGPARFTGDVYETRGPAFDSPSFDPARVEVSRVGHARFDFTDADNGSVRFTTDRIDETFEAPITRQVFASPGGRCTFDDEGARSFQDLWWRSPAGAEAGWGLNIAHQGSKLFATWFTYGSSGAATWFVASDLSPGPDGTYSGPLYRTTGTALARPWDPSRLSVTAVGQASVRFGSEDEGTFSYIVDGVAGSKPITRQVFSSPMSRCD